jgi:hypothetical protein
MSFASNKCVNGRVIISASVSMVNDPIYNLAVYIFSILSKLKKKRYPFIINKSKWKTCLNIKSSLDKEALDGFTKLISSPNSDRSLLKKSKGKTQEQTWKSKFLGPCLITKAFQITMDATTLKDTKTLSWSC